MTRRIKIENNEDLNTIITFLRDGSYPIGYIKSNKRSLRRKVESFCLVNDQLCYKEENGLVKRAIFDFQTGLVQIVLQEEHNNGHIGIRKLIELINQKYFGISSKSVTDFVKSCASCQRYNNLTTVQDIIINTITKKYDRYMMDCVDLRRYSVDNDGYAWILNVMDTYTKYLWSFELKNKNAESIRDSLIHIFDNYGLPIEIQSDNGKEFRNNMLKEVLLNLNIKIIHGRPRNPRAQGQIERLNQTIKRRISKCLFGLGNMRWIDVLDKVVKGYNRTNHSATGKSPFLLFHGHSGFRLRSVNNMELIEVSSGNLVPFIEEVFEDNLTFIEENWDLANTTRQTISDNDNLVTVDESLPISNQIIISEVARNFETYRNRLLANSNQNTVNRRIEIGDKIILKLDFDTNVDTRRGQLEPFFSVEDYTVIAILDNNMYRIKGNTSNCEQNVHSGRLKKIN